MFKPIKLFTVPNVLHGAGNWTHGGLLHKLIRPAPGAVKSPLQPAPVAAVATTAALETGWVGKNTSEPLLPLAVGGSSADETLPAESQAVDRPALAAPATSAVQYMGKPASARPFPTVQIRPFFAFG